MRGNESKFGMLALALVCLFAVPATNAIANQDTYIKSVYSLPLSLDPIKMNDTASLVAGNMIYDGLLRFSPTLAIEGALAESWKTSADGKTLTFTLRSNARFHNGSPIEAEDVVASLRRALTLQSDVRKYYDCIEGSAGEGISAKSPTTVEIKLKHAYPPFLSVLAGATAKILPRKLISTAGFFDHPVGSGPFKFKEVIKGSTKDLVLTAFHNYYRAAPKIETLVLREMSEADSVKAALAGTVQDLANWPLGADSLAFKTGKNITSPVAATWIIGLNTRKRPFNSLTTRQLFRQDLDAEGFRKIFYSEAFPATGYVPPGLPGHNEKIQIRKLVKGVRSKQEITIVIPKELARADEMCAFLEKNLRSHGWNAHVITTDWAKLMEGYGKKTLQAFLVSMNMDYPDADFLLRNFESTNPDNFSGLKLAKVDQALLKARNLQDRKQRQAIYQKAIDLVDEQAVTVNLFHPRANYWTANCVEGLKPNILADVYIDYSSVYLNHDCLTELSKK